MSKSVSFGRKVNLFFKRSFDIIFSLMMIAALALPCAVVALAVALDMHAGPFFTQDRVGRDGKLFRMIKFRTMTPDAPKDVPTYELQDAHKYITRLGNILRKTSIDEFPQLINILCGDMSFIGPRPVVPDERTLNRLRLERGALRVRPGMTGWAQVHGRDRVTIVEKVEYDAYYADHCSIALDINILVRTVICLFTTKDIVEGENPAIRDHREAETPQNGKEKES